ncbi:MAG: hypothetical protein KBS95_07110, partial [Alistipes sp.]|nr:hypothetical protein [Candidatus Alistipes equi]
TSLRCKRECHGQKIVLGASKILLIFWPMFTGLLEIYVKNTMIFSELQEFFLQNDAHKAINHISEVMSKLKLNKSNIVPDTDALLVCEEW